MQQLFAKLNRARTCTREELLQRLADGGFKMERLHQVQAITANEKCDLLDVLEYVAYQIEPMERKARVEMMYDSIMKGLAEKQIPFIEFVLQQYVDEGFEELSMDRLKHLLELKYETVFDAKKKMDTDTKTISKIFVNFQKTLYA